MNPQINPPNHPPTHQTIHRFQIFKLKYLNSFKFYYLLIDLLGPPWSGVGGCECMGVSHVCTHVYTPTHVYYIMEIPQGFPYGGGHLHEISMFNIHACACVHVCVCVGYPHTHTHTHP